MLWKSPSAGNALSNQPAATAGCVVDETTKEPPTRSDILLYTLGAFFHILKALPDIDSEIERGMCVRRAFRTESLENMVVTIGVQTDNFLPTVEVHDRCNDAGYDFVFGKDRRHLQEIGTRPFCAVRLAPTTFTVIPYQRSVEVLAKGHRSLKLCAAPCCTGSCLGGSCGLAVFAGQTAGGSALEHVRR